ncbi:MAG: ATP-binding protein [Solirubrobacteraceae bacterium]
MHIADRSRDPRTVEKTRPAGVGDRLPAGTPTCEWPTERTKTTDPVSACRELDFTHDLLRTLRRFVALSAAEASLDPARIDDLVLAINELATNSVCHAGGAGTLRIWREGDVLRCDVHDQGHMRQPSVCPIAPEPTQITGRGLWIVSQLCDLVQIHASHRGSVVRVHMRLT